MKLPSPYDCLAGCLWLPRILAKARRLAAGTLPDDYAARFGHPTGVDGQFLGWFGLTKEEIVAAATGSDDEAAVWFNGRFSKEEIDGWNHTARNLGRPGFPMEERLPIAKATSYAHLDTTGIDNVFDVLVLDESED
ncbi:DUF5069 domain-containing protein [Luteolibacter ambystomatis]|uniref:DUF5069 domain-containing protein n=1 Tax=Luteolibacter ambystomatis TaxID=2824561 RepID=A0A975J1N4_9BACT|nr:DUF5069 domain-containing protein [Luteolibacter ambystomatis]QUE52371.1 DUF5069 domain-containing protein [Luteolibacter ambystomatis]